MTVPDGTYRLGPAQGQSRLMLRTAREGMAAKAGHDLSIEVRDWEGTATVATDEPSRCSVEVTIRADSMYPVEGRGGVKPLTDGDRQDIGKNIRDKVLRTDRFPTISFRSTAVSGAPDNFTVDGELTLNGQSHPLSVHGRLTSSPEGVRAEGETTVRQTEWGITPYKGFLGALKVADDVGVDFDLVLAPADSPNG